MDIKAGTAYGVLPNDSSADFDEFARSTQATRTNKDGLLEIMGNNVPRIDYSDGVCPSLLLEPQRTNECRGSENVMVWSTNRGVSVNRDSNQIISPDGSKSADLVTTEDENAGVFSLEMTTISNTVYSTSVYAKHIAGGSKLRFGISTNLHFASGEKRIIVDLSDGSIVDNELAGVAEPKVIDVGNGWYRLIIEHSSVVSGGGGGAYFFCYADDVSFSQFSVWGGQIEVGGYTSSYIQNANTASGGQTTRNNDKGNLAGNFDVLDNDSGVLEARFKAFDTTNTSRRITLGATQYNRVVLGYGYNNGTVKPYLLIVGATGNDEVYISMPSSFNIFDYNTYQLKFQSGNNELKINGELVDTDTSFNTLNFTFSASLTNISLNYYNNSSNRRFEGGLKHIKVYDSITDF